MASSTTTPSIHAADSLHLHSKPQIECNAPKEYSQCKLLRDNGVRLSIMVTKLPKERDFDPVGGGLDEQHAWRNFGGLTLDEAYEKFVSAPEIYQEDFMWMGGKAFAFYYPVIDRFLRETIDLPVDERGDRQSWILPHCIRGQFVPVERRYVSALKQPVIDLCDFMLQHIQYFADDWDDPTEIENNWRHLQEHVRQYK